MDPRIREDDKVLILADVKRGFGLDLMYGSRIVIRDSALVCFGCLSSPDLFGLAASSLTR